MIIPDIQCVWLCSDHSCGKLLSFFTYRSFDLTSGNQLVECQECHNLYHQVGNVSVYAEYATVMLCSHKSYFLFQISAQLINKRNEGFDCACPRFLFLHDQIQHVSLGKSILIVRN